MFRYKCLSTLFVLCVITNVFAASADLTGEWRAKMESPQATVAYVFTFEMKGDSFTGSVKVRNEGEETVGQITDGKIDGDKVSFVVHIPIAGQPGTVTAKGTVAGNEMKLTVEGEDPHDGHKKMELKLTRASSN